MAQLTDDCFAFGGRLISIDRALDEMRGRLRPIAGVDRLPVTEALGRVLAEPVTAPRAVPPHDNSAVDGYLVFHGDLDPHGPTVLPITGQIRAGHPLDRPTRRGEALQVLTGAAMPDGRWAAEDGRLPDTIFMEEDCVISSGSIGDLVTVPPGIRPGANYRLKGEDVAEGAVVLETGTRLRPQDLGIAASVGLTRLPVYAPLRIAVFSTGDELVDPGDGRQPAPGQIFDSNRTTLAGLITAAGHRVIDRGILADDRRGIAASLAELAALGRDGGLDVIMTSGGVSAGSEDHVKTALAEAGGRLHAWRLAIKPGRPVALGQLGPVPFLGLPGSPVAVVVTFLFVVRPILDLLAGAVPRPPLRLPAVLGFDYQKKRNRREFVRARLDPTADGTAPVAQRAGAEGAGVLSSLVAAEGLLELAEDLTECRAGDPVPFIPFQGVL